MARAEFTAFRELSGDRRKPAAWRLSTRRTEWHSRPWSGTSHLGVMASRLDLPDLGILLEHGRVRLGLWRRAIRRVRHNRALMRYARILENLVLMVSEYGAVITAWFRRWRRCQPAGSRNESNGLGWREP